MTENSPIPVTILSGFLGAGKSTLLSHILKHADRRYAVIVNDFGEINIDTELVAEYSCESIDLSNGCICCSVQGSLLSTLNKLKERENPPEYLIIECSGVAEPFNLATVFLGHAIRPHFRLDGILGLADASAFFELNEGEHRELFWNQLGAASFVLLTKTDLVSPEQLRQVREAISQELPKAPTLEVAQGEIPPSLILDSRIFDEVSLPQPSKNLHLGNYQSWNFQTEQPLSISVLQKQVKKLSNHALRLKGVLHVKERPGERALLQVAGRRTSLERLPLVDSQAKISKVVAIGRVGSINTEALQACFEGMIAPS